MSIIGQNSIINQFVPKFVLKAMLDGQILVWDSNKNAFVNQPYRMIQGGLSIDERRQFEMLRLMYLESGATFTAPVFNVTTTQYATRSYNLLITSTTPATGGSISWGDSTSSVFTAYSDDVFSHTYSQSIEYTITVTLTNVYGSTTFTKIVNPSTDDLEVLG